MQGSNDNVSAAIRSQHGSSPSRLRELTRPTLTSRQGDRNLPTRCEGIRAMRHDLPYKATCIGRTIGTMPDIVVIRMPIPARSAESGTHPVRRHT